VDTNAFLPLPTATFHILLALADEDRHGYAIIQDVEERTGGDLRLSPGTLYRSIQRMLEQGLIVETTERPAPDLDDERRRYYRMTPFGEAVARAELRRIEALVRIARKQGLTPGRA
jgi:DNA-binding PadR family transcriptional regulator